MMSICDVASPLGRIRIVEKAGKITRVIFAGNDQSPFWPACTPLLQDANSQLTEYFAGIRKIFDLPLELHHLSPFAHDIMQQLLQVPFGTTVTYRDLSLRAGHARAARAVGRAMAMNHLPLFIPCHRVVGAKGDMVGYSGGEGISTKVWLLEHERKHRWT